METVVAAVEPDGWNPARPRPATGEMRGGIALSLALHLGLLALGWIAVQSRPEPPSADELAISVELVPMQDAVTEPSETISEESVNLVSAGLTQVPSETEVTETVEADPVEPIAVAAAQPVAVAVASVVTETIEPAETEAVVSAQVLTALATTDTPIIAPIPLVTDDAASVAPETVAPSDAPILDRLDQAARLTELEPALEAVATASINPLAKVIPAETADPVKIANLNPIPEPIVEEVLDTPPVPAPRIVRKPVEEEPVEKKTAEKPAEKPVDKKPKQVASLGNGGEAEADSAAAKASGGPTGKIVSAGRGAIDAYEGKVRAKFLKALRKPRDAKRGEVRVIFRLDADGRVIKSKLSRSSGDDKLDQAALAAIERAAPYPPIPVGAGRSTWDITIPIGIN